MSLASLAVCSPGLRHLRTLLANVIDFDETVLGKMKLNHSPFPFLFWLRNKVTGLYFWTSLQKMLEMYPRNEQKLKAMPLTCLHDL